MPYIKKEDREKLAYLVDRMGIIRIETAGDLNYLITQLVHSFLESHEAGGYQAFNDAIGALEGSKLELYRQHVAKYEDEKIKSNGDVP